MLRQYAVQSFDFDDIILVPKTGVLKSRSEADTSIEFGGRQFNLPIIPANMSTIVDESTCAWLAREGYFYVMHRFTLSPIEVVKYMREQGVYASVAVGIKQYDRDMVSQMADENLRPEYITIDVAHGDSEEVLDMVNHITHRLPESFLIVGNIATVEAALKLADAGVDAVKCGIGPGSACLTTPNTGFGTRGYQLTAIALIAEALENTEVKIIGDGGIRKYGDIAKAVAFGADLVMVGGMLSGHDENPGEIIDINGEQFKAFFGSASEHQKGEQKHVEGKRMFMPYKGSLSTTLQVVKENLQSSISYAGGRKLFDLREVEYVLLRSADRVDN